MTSSSRVRAVVALAISGGLLLAGCGTEQAAEDPAPTASSSTPSPSEPTEPAAAPQPLDLGPAPALRPTVRKLALKASRDGFVPMVASEVPEGWEALGAGYQSAEPRRWHLAFTAPGGEVTLDQLEATPEEILTGQAGVVPGEPVDLSAYGTGTWDSATRGGTTILMRALKHNTVVVQAPDLDSALALAQGLLPAEDASGPLG